MVPKLRKAKKKKNAGNGQVRGAPASEEESEEAAVIWKQQLRLARTVESTVATTKVRVCGAALGNNGASASFGDRRNAAV